MQWLPVSGLAIGLLCDLLFEAQEILLGLRNNQVSLFLTSATLGHTESFRSATDLASGVDLRSPTCGIFGMTCKFALADSERIFITDRVLVIELNVSVILQKIVNISFLEIFIFAEQHLLFFRDIRREIFDVAHPAAADAHFRAQLHGLQREIKIQILEIIDSDFWVRIDRVCQIQFSQVTFQIHDQISPLATKFLQRDLDSLTLKNFF